MSPLSEDMPGGSAAGTGTRGIVYGNMTGEYPAHRCRITVTGRERRVEKGTFPSGSVPFGVQRKYGAKTVKFSAARIERWAG